MQEQLELSSVRKQLAIYDDAIAAGRPLPTSFTARFGALSPHDESSYNTDMMLDYVRRLRAFEKESTDKFLACEAQLDMLMEQNRRRLFLARQQQADRNPGYHNQSAPRARQELDATDSSEAAAQSTGGGGTSSC